MLTETTSAQLGKRLLFVDDEPNIRATLPVILRRYGFTVAVAAKIAEALKEVETQAFDILVCDLNVEREGDGYEVIRAIRHKNPRCVVIVLTGFPALSSAIEGIQEHIDDYVVKPSNPDHLVALLADKLAKRKPKARILSVSYDLPLMRTRQMLLEAQGYEVASAVGLDGGLQRCQEGGFDLFVLGHSISDEEKKKLVEAFRQTCSGPIISLRRSIGEQRVDGADYHIDPDPEPLLKLVADLVSKNKQQGLRETRKG